MEAVEAVEKQHQVRRMNQRRHSGPSGRLFPRTLLIHPDQPVAARCFRQPVVFLSARNVARLSDPRVTCCWLSREYFAPDSEQVAPVVESAPPARRSIATSADLAGKGVAAAAGRPHRQPATRMKPGLSNRGGRGQPRESRSGNQQTWCPPEFWCLFLF